MWVDQYAYDGNPGEMELMPSFEKEQIISQLRKVVDSESAGEVVDPKKFKILNWVTTDDGDELPCNADEARKMLESIENVPAPQRLEVIKFVQTTKGFLQLKEVIGKL